MGGVVGGRPIAMLLTKEYRPVFYLIKEMYIRIFFFTKELFPDNSEMCIRICVGVGQLVVG